MKDKKPRVVVADDTMKSDKFKADETLEKFIAEMVRERGLVVGWDDRVLYVGSKKHFWGIAWKRYATLWFNPERANNLRHYNLATPN